MNRTQTLADTLIVHAVVGISIAAQLFALALIRGGAPDGAGSHRQLVAA